MSSQNTKNVRILKLATVLFIIWGILGLKDVKNLSYSGYSTDGNNTISKVREGSPSEKANMQVGDIMVSYDGILMSDTKSFSKRDRTKIGDIIEIVVDRNGEEQTLSVTYTELPDMRNNLRIVAFIIALLFIVLGLYVNHKKKTSLSFAFAVFAILFGFIFFNGPYINPGLLKDFVNSTNTTLIMFAFVALARFILQYPPKSTFLNAGNSRWIYAPAAVIVTIIWSLNFLKPDNNSTLNISLNMIFFVIIVFYFGLGFITLIRKYLNTNANERITYKLNYMLLGAVLGLLPFLIYFTINQISPSTVLPGNDYIFVTFAFIPIFFSLAVLQKNN